MDGYMMSSQPLHYGQPLYHPQFADVVQHSYDPIDVGQPLYRPPFVDDGGHRPLYCPPFVGDVGQPLYVLRFFDGGQPLYYPQFVDGDQPLYHPQFVDGGFGYIPDWYWTDHDDYLGFQNQISSNGQVRDTDFVGFNAQFEDEAAIIDVNNFNTGYYVFDESRLLYGMRSAADGESMAEPDKNLLARLIWRHLRTRIYQAPPLHVSDEDPGFCVVCLSDFADSENLGKLDCGHEYHADCIHGWLLEKNFCPLCKRTGIRELEE